MSALWNRIPHTIFLLRRVHAASLRHFHAPDSITMMPALITPRIFFNGINTFTSSLIATGLLNIATIMHYDRTINLSSTASAIYEPASVISPKCGEVISISIQVKQMPRGRSPLEQCTSILSISYDKKRYASGNHSQPWNTEDCNKSTSRLP